MTRRLCFICAGASAYNVFGSAFVTSITIILLCDYIFDTFLDLVACDSSEPF